MDPIIQVSLSVAGQMLVINGPASETRAALQRGLELIERAVTAALAVTERQLDLQQRQLDLQTQEVQLRALIQHRQERAH